MFKYFGMQPIIDNFENSNVSNIQANNDVYENDVSSSESSVSSSMKEKSGKNNKISFQHVPCNNTNELRVNQNNELFIMRKIKRRKKVYIREGKRQFLRISNCKNNLLNKPAANNIKERKNKIIFNGTFPIDMPFCSRFSNRKTSPSSSSTETDFDCVAKDDDQEKFYDSFNQNYIDSYMQIPNQFKNVLRHRNVNNSVKFVKTFDIDEPLDLE